MSWATSSVSRYSLLFAGWLSASSAGFFLELTLFLATPGLVADMDILNTVKAELERATPFEAAQDRANIFCINLYLAYSMDECIKHNFSAEAPVADFDQKMILAATTLEATRVSA